MHIYIQIVLDVAARVYVCVCNPHSISTACLFKSWSQFKRTHICCPRRMSAGTDRWRPIREQRHASQIEMRLYICFPVWSDSLNGNESSRKLSHASCTCTHTYAPVCCFCCVCLCKAVQLWHPLGPRCEWLNLIERSHTATTLCTNSKTEGWFLNEANFKSGLFHIRAEKLQRELFSARQTMTGRRPSCSLALAVMGTGSSCCGNYGSMDVTV